MKWTHVAHIGVLAAASAMSWTQPVAQGRFDVLIRGGQVVDGAGTAARRADIGIVGDRIRAMGDLSTRHGRRP